MDQQAKRAPEHLQGGFLPCGRYTETVTVPAGTEHLARIIGPVADRFEAGGFRLYLVGGVVRDVALFGASGFDPSGNDIDLTTDAGPQEIKKLIAPLAEAVWTQGERFGTIGATVSGQPVEITTHRAEAYDPDSRKPIVTFGDDLYKDLARRDFTINAVAIALPGLVLHDPYDGLRDLASRALKTPLSPEISFTDDPLRMMRAARFITRFDLTPAPDLVVAATELADRLSIVSVERVTDELERLLKVASPHRGLSFLVETGLLHHILPAFATIDPEEVTRAIGFAATTTVDGAPADPIVRRAGLLFPIRHQAKEELTRLRYSKAETAVTCRLLDAVTAVLERPITDRSVRRLVAKVGVEGVDQVMVLAAAVGASGSSEETAATPPADLLAETLAGLRASEDLTDLDSPLSGTEIMEILGIEQGQTIGRATEMLRRARLDRGPLSPQDAAEILRSWWAETRVDGKP